MALPDKACGYKPESPYLEMSVSRTFSYLELATRAAEVCGKEVEGKSLALFKPYTCVIIPMGRYL